MIEAITAPMSDEMEEHCQEVFASTMLPLESIQSKGFRSGDPKKHMVVSLELPGQSPVMRDKLF